MAAKKKTLPQVLLPSSSSESDSDEDSQIPQVNQKPTIASPRKSATKQPLPPPSSSSEEESEDESEEEMESSESDVPVAPKKEQTLTRKEPPLAPKEKPSTQKEPPSKEIPSTPKGPPLPNKEASESDSETEEEESSQKTASTISKKRKSVSEKEKEPASVASSSGKKLFQRLWTEEDEVTLIKMLTKYKKMHGKLPSSPTENCDFHEFVRSALHIDFSRVQLMKKIRSIKIKYYSNLAKTDNGKKNYQKDHDKLCFELSRNVWGDTDLKKVEKDDDAGDNGEKDVTANGTAKKRKTKTAAETPQHEASLKEGPGVHSEILVSALDEISMVFPSISKVSYKHLSNAIGNLEAEEVRSFENELRLLNVNQLLLANKRHTFLNKLLSATTRKLDFPFQ